MCMCVCVCVDMCAHVCVCERVCMHVVYWCGIGSVYMWYVGECRCADCE